MPFRKICGAIMLTLLACLVLPPWLFAQKDDPVSSQCVACHADLKKLMRLCWKIEKIRPKPQASAETSGEG